MAKSLTFFKERQRPAADWIVPGLLKRGNTAFIIGPPKKAAKSWLILDLCWSLSEGREVWNVKRSNGSFLFVPPRAMRCVYFAQEDTEDDMDDRMRAHFGLSKQPNDKLWVVPKDLRIVFDSEEGRRLMQGELDAVESQAGKIDLVCFDPMRRMHRGDENDSQTIAKMWEMLDIIHRRYGCSTLIAHHIRKPPQDRTNYDPSDPFNARGSGDIFGGGDAFVTIDCKRRTPDAHTLGIYFESKRGRPLPPQMVKVHLPEEATGKFKVGVERSVEWMGLAYEPEQPKEGEARASLTKG